MQSPNVTQVPMTPIDGSAQVKSPSHGRTSEPSPTRLEARLSGPLASYTQTNAWAITTPAISCGRKSVVRKKRKPRILVRVSAAVRSEADDHGDHGVERDQHRRVDERGQQHVVADRLAVVREPDPGLRRQPVPGEERE